MSNKTVVIFIPHVFPYGNWREFGGALGMKKYLKKTFASQEKSSTLIKIGIVKHMDIVLNKKTSSMLEDYCAFVRFIPSGSEYCAKILSIISQDNKFRFYHNQSRGFYWDFYLSNKETAQKVQDKAVQTVQVATILSTSTGTTSQDNLDILCNKLNELYFDGRAKKRQRLEV